jgi:hypothetical protein
LEELHQFVDNVSFASVLQFGNHFEDVDSGAGALLNLQIGTLHERSQSLLKDTQHLSRQKQGNVEIEFELDEAINKI